VKWKRIKDVADRPPGMDVAEIEARIESISQQVPKHEPATTACNL